MSFVSVKSLSKYFGASVVLSDLSFELESGTCLLVKGPNGCGKSTLLSCVSGLLQPDEGSIQVDGMSMWNSGDFAKIRSQVGLGILTQSNLLYSGLTVEENLKLFSGLSFRGSKSGGLRKSLIERLGLERFKDHRIEQCSQGIARRVGLVRALVGNPKLLLLDEPFANLDTMGIAICTQILSEFVEDGCCVILVSHQTAELRDLVTKTLHFDENAPCEVTISAGFKEVQNG